VAETRGGMTMGVMDDLRYAVRSLVRRPSFGDFCGRHQRETLESEQFATTIMAVFATFALLLAAVGLYGVVSVAGTRILESRIVEVEASPWGTFLTAVLTLGLTALLAAYAPARRATRVDPVEA
jgi:ABC-type antimicrobial peptide transport system permease subunit